MHRRLISGWRFAPQRKRTSQWHLRVWLPSKNDLRVLVVLEANTIVVTILGTHYSITYRTLHDSPWLIASDIRDDQNSPISKWTFRARAWTAANDKAREIGWIV